MLIQRQLWMVSCVHRHRDVSVALACGGSTSPHSTLVHWGIVDGVTDLLTENGIAILRLTKTWHEVIDDVPLGRLRASGFQVLERAL